MAEPQTMRAVDIHNSTGPATALHINPSVAKPTPKPTECLVRVRAFGINRADTLQREGKYPVPPGVSKILGLEFSGVVDQVGTSPPPDAKHTFHEGDEVFGLTYGGAYAEFVPVSKRMLIRKPAELGWEVAAGVCEAYFTALQALHLVGGYDPARVQAVLWHAGGSGVSIAGLQLTLRAHRRAGAAHPPLRVCTTVRTPAKAAALKRRFPAVDVIDTSASGHAQDWPEELRRRGRAHAASPDPANEGADLIVDYVGAPYFAGNLAALNRDGRVVQLGAMGGLQLAAGTDVSAFITKRVRWEGSTLRSRDEAYQGRLRDLFEEVALEGLRSGELYDGVSEGGTVMSWREVAEAHRMMEENRNLGKIVCVVD